MDPVNTSRSSGGYDTEIIETENFQKCQDVCEKDEECRGVTFAFKQCKIQKGNIFVIADPSTVGCFYEGAIKLIPSST